jgi:hypothetical protein
MNMSKKEKFLRNLSEFVEAMDRLVESWEQIDADDFDKTWSDKYPFRLSFDELYYEVCAWRDDINEKLTD